MRYPYLLILIALMLGSAAPEMLAQSTLDGADPADRVYDVFELVDAELPQFDETEFMHVLRYPDDARAANIEGVVTVGLVIDTAGRASEIQAIMSDSPLLTEAALDAVQHYQFRPGRRQGRAIVVRMAIPVRFSLIDK